MNRPFITSFWTLPAHQRSAGPWIPGGCTTPAGAGRAGGWCWGVGGGKWEKDEGAKDKRKGAGRSEEEEKKEKKEKEEWITVVCWALLASVLSTLQTFSRSPQQPCKVSTANTSVVQMKILRLKWGHLPKAKQLVSSRAVIWTQAGWPQSSSTTHSCCWWKVSYSWTTEASLGIAWFYSGLGWHSHDTKHLGGIYKWLCYGLNSEPPKFICWGPNLQYLRIWPYLEIGALKRWFS